MLRSWVTNGERRRIWSKEERPSYQAEQLEKRLVEPSAVQRAVQLRAQVPPVTVRLLAGKDLTVDEMTSFQGQARA